MSPLDGMLLHEPGDVILIYFAREYIFAAAAAEIAGMDNHSCDGQGVIITFAELEAKLVYISEGQHEWTARLERVEDHAELGWPPICALVWFSNPGMIDMPNGICYRFPAFAGALCSDSDTLVCLHPSLMDVLARGLYFEGDKLMWDCMEDFGRFWEPLRKVL
jgi:hypothetical protein